MEEETHPDSGVGAEKLSEVKVDGNVQAILINGDENPQGQEENEHCEKGIPHSSNEKLRNSSNDLFEAQDKIRVLELQLQTVNEELRNFDSNSSKLKSELDLANEKLKLTTTQYEDLQLEHKKMREETSAKEHKYNLQGVSLQDALKDLDGKHKEVADTKEALDGLTAELESSKKKLKELALQLEETACQARRFEEQSNQSSSHAESHSQRALELEKMMEAAKLSSNEMEHHVNKLQEELKLVNLRLEENKQVEEALTATKVELAKSLEKLDVSKSHIGELEQELFSKEADIGKLSQELDLYKYSEDQKKKEKLEFESILFSLKEDLQAKTVALEEVKSKLDDEIKDRETVENRLQNQEIQITGFQEQLVNLKGDKETLQSKLEVLTASENELKAQVMEKEARLISAEKKNIDFELQISFVEQQYADAEKEMKELGEKSKELTVLLGETEKNHAQSRCHVQEYKDRVNLLESSLNDAYSEKSDFEQELTHLAEKHAVLEEQVKVSHQRSSELHDLVQVSESKLENNEKKVTELELLLEAVEQEKQEMEQHLKFTEGKFKDAEVQLEQQTRKVLELSTKLEELKENSERLVVDLQSANDKEKELIEMLAVVTEERKKHEDLSNSSAGKLLQTENLIEDLQIGLKYTQEKLATVERDLEISCFRENELKEKIKSTEEELEHERKSAERSLTRVLELESLHDFLVKDYEQKLEAAEESFSTKDIEAKRYYNESTSLAEQLLYCQEQLAKATEKLAYQMMDLEASAARLATQEATVEDLTRKLSISEAKAEQSFADSAMVKKELDESQSKIKELFESLSAIHAEKETMDSKLLSYLQNITDLTDDRARSSEYQSQIEASIKKTEAQLCDALERCAQRDSEAQELNEKLLAFESQLKAHEENANEAVSVAKNRKAELEDAMLKIQNLEVSVDETKSRASHFENKHEDLSQTNLGLSQKIAEYETKVNELDAILKAITAEKEDASLQLHASSKTIEDLSQQLVYEREKIQSQISSILDENNRINKMYKDAKKEVEELKVQLQEMQNVHKTAELSFNADLENLKAELSQNSQLQSVISELEQQLSAAESKHKEEISSIYGESNRTNKMYQDATDELQNLKEELSQKSQLQAVISELEQKLSAADTKHKEEIENTRQTAAEKDVLLEAKVHEHASIVQQRDVLAQQLDDLQKDYNSLIAEQKESVLRMQQDREYVVISSHDELETEQQRSLLLEKQIEELKQKLETVQSQNKKVDASITEDHLEGVESKSRDFELSAKLPSKRKNRKKSVELDAEKASPSTSGASIMEHSGINSLKFFSGVVVVSLFIGIYLGKRY